MTKLLVASYIKSIYASSTIRPEARRKSPAASDRIPAILRDRCLYCAGFEPNGSFCYFEIRNLPRAHPASDSPRGYIKVTCNVFNSPIAFLNNFFCPII